MANHLHRPGDATVELGEGDHAVVRMYISPLWTVLSSVFEVLLGWRRGCPAEWSEFVRERADGLDLSAFGSFDRPDRTVPNFLLPVPPNPAPTMQEELAALRATPAKVVRRDLRAEFGRKVPKEFLTYAVDPAVAFAEFSETVERYWDAVFAPIWSRVRAVLDREVVLWGRTLATEGVTVALTSLHPSFRLKGDALMFDLARPGHVTSRLENRRLVLIPVVAGTGANITSVDRPGEIVLAYAARGASAVWHRPDISPDSGLARLFGDTRARIIACLDQDPMTTTLLAADLDLAPATISHHLSTLVEQEMIESTRVGNSVFYSLSERGRSLTQLFVDSS